MFLSIDPSNGIAIYEQIARQVKFAIANETLMPGDLVPSVRELARDLAINANIVARAYRELQVDEVLSGVRGTGLEVTRKAPPHCKRERIKLIRQRLCSVFREAGQAQLDPAEVRKLVDEELAACTESHKHQRS